MKANYKILLVIFSIFALQLIVFLPSFKLAIFGDDWLTLWRYLRVVKENTYSQGYNFLTYFLTPYGPQDITFGLIYDMFKLNPVPYYLFSFLFRFLAALSSAFLIYKFTKNIFASLCAGAFFAVTIVGLDTTNWVFNMPNYLGVAFTSLFILFFVWSSATRKLIFIAYLFLFLAMLIAPIRMHGTVPLIIACEIFWVLLNRTKQSVRTSASRVILFFLLLYIVRIIGSSFGNPAEPFQRVSAGLVTFRNMFILENQKEVLLFPLTLFGNMLLPEMLWQHLTKAFEINIFGRIRPFPTISIFCFSIYLLLVNTLAVKNKSTYRKVFWVMAIIGILFNFLVYVLYKNNPFTFSSLDRFGATLVGGYFLLFLLSNLFVVKRKIEEKLLFFLTIILPLAFMGYPWIFTPYTIFPAAHRYMLIPALGVSLMWGLLLKDRKPALVILVLFAGSLFVNASLTRNYLETLVSRRGIPIADKVWNPANEKLPTITENDNYYVVYFEPDNKNGDIVHANLSFGFPPRMSLRDNIIDPDKIPVAISVYEDLVQMVATGGPLLAHAKKVEPLSIERIYGFKVHGEDETNIFIEDITEKIRKDLKRNSQF